ncbi:MAG: MarR family winged helix-turn-helix transcriptional regulator [Sphingomonadaceae bacterium]
MIHVILDMRRPSEIARSLGLTRQAVHRTIGMIIQKGLFHLKPDPDDKRGSIINLTEQGDAMRSDAQHIARMMFAELKHRIGHDKIDAMIEAVTQDWGPVPSFGPNDKRLS